MISAYGQRPPLSRRVGGGSLKTMVLVPRFDRARTPETAISEPLLNRKRAAEPSHSAQKSLRRWVPAGNQHDILQSVGFKPVESHAWPRLASDEEGLYVPLDSLGVTLAYARDGERGQDRLRDRLGQDYHVVSDFYLSTPTPLDDDDNHLGTAAGGHPADWSRWSDEAGIAEAHARNVDGQKIMFGVLDSGIDADHKDFAGRRVPIDFGFVHPRIRRYPVRQIRGFDTTGHGTHVCGILAGRSRGVARKARLVVASLLEAEDHAVTASSVVAAVDWAIGRFNNPRNARRPMIVNLSLGFPVLPPADRSGNEYHEQLESFRSLIEFLVDANILVVAAIGNDGEDCYCLPAGEPGVLSVGSVDAEFQVSSFSGCVPVGGAVSGPDVVGFGEDVESAAGRNIHGQSLFGFRSGTSQATPYVAGIAALYWSQATSLTAGQVAQILKETALPIDGERKRVGHGLARWQPGVI